MTKIKIPCLNLSEIRLGATCYYRKPLCGRTYQVWTPALIKHVERTTKGIPVVVTIWADEKQVTTVPANLYPSDIQI
jgi:hypothetical protein